ncbi:hypothetical protein GCM10010136_09490 [Limoniibacter endophyticus]|uniref:Uncharacterized protein n=1 Tax=Limoniibacter endophyticus TaxID=1565040 RepID=A0A8J3DG35_9HYPH|nr:hypothetical protein GCM10010136_09490 [Limoniibacter endophyticus]
MVVKLAIGLWPFGGEKRKSPPAVKRIRASRAIRSNSLTYKKCLNLGVIYSQLTAFE